MKGIVFSVLSDLVVEKFGIEMLNDLIDTVQPESKGAYTAGTSYSDAELMALVACLSEKTKIPVNTLVTVYGEYLFGQLIKKYPVFIKPEMSLFDFLETIDGVIHIEVRKLYNEPSLPTLETERLDDTTLKMIYHSPRKLCHLAIGLIQGAAQYFKKSESLSLEHVSCMHDGKDNCVFMLNLS